MMLKRAGFLVIIITILIPQVSFSHSGGTDSNGCHTDSSTGTRHCHNSSNSSESSDSGGSVELIILAVILVSGIIYWQYSSKSSLKSNNEGIKNRSNLRPLVEEDDGNYMLGVSYHF